MHLYEEPYCGMKVILITILTWFVISSCHTGCQNSMVEEFFPITFLFPYREVHSVCSWDEKASVRIQKALEHEIHLFISDAQKVIL